MSAVQTSALLRHIRRLSKSAVALTDRQLLARFIAKEDEAAFAELVGRHGALVLDVCRRTLQCEQDAEDAFQATFLVPARKSASIRKTESPASWLYGVAWRCAAKLRADFAERRRRERQAMPSPTEEPPDPSWREVQEALHEELARLPEKYRAPLVLCYLEGRTQCEAAQQLACGQGVLRGRLDRGRERLQQRLLRRGITLSAAMLAARVASSKPVSAALIQSTQKAAMLVAAGRTVTAAVSPTVAALVDSAVGVAGAKAKLALVVILAGIIGGTLGLASSEQPAVTVQQVKGEAKEAAAFAKADERKTKTDLHGDPLPPGAVARMGTTRFRHGGIAYEVAFTPDGSRLVSTDLKSIHIWEAATGKEVRRIDTAPRSMTLSRDGKRLATSEHNQGLIQIWDLASGEVVRGFKNAPDLDDRFCSVQFSPDGKLLASFGNKRIRLWDSSTGEKLREWIADPETIHCLLFTPDSKTILSGGDDKSIHFWDAATGKEFRHIDDHPGTVNHLALTADGKMIASIGATKLHGKPGALMSSTTWFTDDKVHLWDCSTLKKVRQLQAKGAGDVEEEGLLRSNAIYDLAFSPDGKSLATTGQDRTIRIWDVPTGKESRRWDSFWISSLAFSADGKVLASGGFDRTIRLWDPATGKELREQPGHRDAVQFMTFSPDSRRLATATSDRSVRLWNTTTGEEVLRINGPQGTLRPLGFSADGRSLTTMGGVSMKGYGADEKIRIWDVATGQERNKTDAGIDGSVCAASRDGRTWAIASYDKSVRVWDAASGQWLPQKIAHIDGIYALGFAADGRTLLGWCGDNRVHVWEVSSGKETRQFGFGQKSDAQKVAFSPDGRWIAHSADQGVIRLYDALTVKEVHRITDLPFRWIRNPSFSPDSRTLAATGTPGQTIALWEVNTGKPRGRFTGHLGYIYTLVFAPDCKHLASGSEDTTALLWDLSRISSSKSSVARPPKDMATAWEELASEDGEKAYQALWSLAGGQDETIAFLKDRLQAVAPADTKRIDQLIGQLDSDDFQVRERATRELEKLDATVEESLRQAIERSASAEVHTRAKALLAKIDPSRSPALVQQLRAVELVERIGTPSARRMLATVAGGAPGARLTRDAKAALQRLDQR